MCSGFIVTKRSFCEERKIAEERKKCLYMLGLFKLSSVLQYKEKCLSFTERRRETMKEKRIARKKKYKKQKHLRNNKITGEFENKRRKIPEKVKKTSRVQEDRKGREDEYSRVTHKCLLVREVHLKGVTVAATVLFRFGSL